MKTRVFNLIILDESGSMQSIKKEDINSVNETVQTIRFAEKKKIIINGYEAVDLELNVK